MERIRSLAHVSIGRGCCFAGLAIGATMMALIYDPPLAFRTGAVLVLIAACVLMIKARNAPKRPYRRTELWMLMDKKSDLPEARIQQALGGILAELYGRYARYAFGIAIGFWLLAIGSELLWSKAEPA
jgi:divalent metal cation (Fe/Co/Zn/Cd) transporter